MNELMKPWRVRIAEAEERRTRVPMAFTDGDKRAIKHPDFCMLGEAARGMGMAYKQVTVDPYMKNLETAAMRAVRNDDTKMAGRVLDSIQIRAYYLRVSAQVAEMRQVLENTAP